MSSQNTVLLLPHQERFLQSPENFPNIRWHFLLAGYGAGKALPVATVIPTPDGYRRFGDIKVGDKVFAANGKPTTVTGVFPQGFKDAYKVTLTDGRSAVCCKEHLWGVYYYSHSDYKYKVMELGEMLEKGIRRPDTRYAKAGGKPRFWLPASPVCEYLEKELPVDPYVLGSFLGNGCMTSTSLALASNDEWQVAKVAERLGAEYRKGKTLYTWLFRKDGRCLRTDHVFPAEWCKTAYYKHIPDEYLTASLQQRKDLLQGLFDTDGCASVTKGQINVNYCTTSEELCKGIQKLLLSFGIVSSYYIRTKNRKHPCYTVTVNCTQEQKTWLFSLPRKLEKASSEVKKSRRNYDRVAIYSVKKLPQQMDMQCIMVDDPSHLFLTEEHIVTHNTRSLAIATLKLCFDLEGVKDEGGLYAKIAVAGFTYAHLEQTFLIDFRAYLEGSKTPYHEDTKNHIITVGTVQVILLQLSEPGKIFGQSIYAALADEIDENTEEVMIEAMKSLSQRVRQILPGHRSPFIMAASTAQGMKGFYRLYCHYKKSGVGFVLIRARTQDNWYLPKEYIIDLWKNFTETERKVYMEGQFLSVTQGRVIPGFDWDRNFIPDSDMDKELYAHERVYIGQDFNCGIGSTLVITSHGEVQLKDIKVGDYVLTRKGFKKVLTTACRGVKIVYDFGRLGFTKDHIAITPQGDKQLWEAKNFYCLKEQSISEYKKLGTLWERLNELKQCFMTGTCGDDIPTALMTHNGNTLQATRQVCTGTSIKSFMEKYLKGITSITKMDTMITDLKLLSVCPAQNMQNFITTCQETILENVHGKTQQKRYSPGISQRKVKHTIQKYLRKLGLQGRSTVNVLASIVAAFFWLKSERLNVALSAGLDTVSREKLTAINEVRQEITETLTLSLKELVLFAERRLQELLQRNTAKNISVIGSVPATNEREAEVYDIEVEDAHEFFANGILVHNCGYNRGSAWVARNGVLHCIKRYDFPETDDMPDIYRYDFPDQDIFWLPDVTIHDQYPHFARSLRKNDIHIIHRSKSPLVEDSCFLISKLCLQGRILIHPQAREVAEAFSTASRGKDNKIPKGVGPTSPIHDIDGARYVCSYLALVLPEFRDIRRGIMSHLASFRAGANETEERLASVSDAGAGYTRIEGSAFTNMA